MSFNRPYHSSSSNLPPLQRKNPPSYAQNGNGHHSREHSPAGSYGGASDSDTPRREPSSSRTSGLIYSHSQSSAAYSREASPAVIFKSRDPHHHVHSRNSSYSSQSGVPTRPHSRDPSPAGSGYRGGGGDRERDRDRDYYSSGGERSGGESSRNGGSQGFIPRSEFPRHPANMGGHLHSREQSPARPIGSVGGRDKEPPRGPRSHIPAGPASSSLPTHPASYATHPYPPHPSSSRHPNPPPVPHRPRSRDHSPAHHPPHPAPSEAREPPVTSSLPPLPKLHASLPAKPVDCLVIPSQQPPSMPPIAPMKLEKEPPRQPRNFPSPSVVPPHPGTSNGSYFPPKHHTQHQQPPYQPSPPPIPSHAYPPHPNPYPPPPSHAGGTPPIPAAAQTPYYPPNHPNAAPPLYPPPPPPNQQYPQHPYPPHPYHAQASYQHPPFPPFPPNYPVPPPLPTLPTSVPTPPSGIAPPPPPNPPPTIPPPPPSSSLPPNPTLIGPITKPSPVLTTTPPGSPTATTVSLAKRDFSSSPPRNRKPRPKSRSPSLSPAFGSSPPPKPSSRLPPLHSISFPSSTEPASSSSAIQPPPPSDPSSDVPRPVPKIKLKLGGNFKKAAKPTPKPNPFAPLPSFKKKKKLEVGGPTSTTPVSSSKWDVAAASFVPPEDALLSAGSSSRPKFHDVNPSATNSPRVSPPPTAASTVSPRTASSAFADLKAKNKDKGKVRTSANALVDQLKQKRKVGRPRNEDRPPGWVPKPRAIPAFPKPPKNKLGAASGANKPKPTKPATAKPPKPAKTDEAAATSTYVPAPPLTTTSTSTLANRNTFKFSVDVSTDSDSLTSLPSEFQSSDSESDADKGGVKEGEILLVDSLDDPFNQPPKDPLALVYQAAAIREREKRRAGFSSDSSLSDESGSEVDDSDTDSSSDSSDSDDDSSDGFSTTDEEGGGPDADDESEGDDEDAEILAEEEEILRKEGEDRERRQKARKERGWEGVRDGWGSGSEGEDFEDEPDEPVVGSRMSVDEGEGVLGMFSSVLGHHSNVGHHHHLPHPHPHHSRRPEVKVLEFDESGAKVGDDWSDESSDDFGFFGGEEDLWFDEPLAINGRSGEGGTLSEEETAALVGGLLDIQEMERDRKLALDVLNDPNNASSKTTASSGTVSRQDSLSAGDMDVDLLSAAAAATLEAADQDGEGVVPPGLGDLLTLEAETLDMLDLDYRDQGTGGTVGMLITEDWDGRLIFGNEGLDAGEFEFDTPSEGDSDGQKDADRMEDLWDNDDDWNSEYSGDLDDGDTTDSLPDEDDGIPHELLYAPDTGLPTLSNTLPSVTKEAPSSPAGSPHAPSHPRIAQPSPLRMPSRHHSFASSTDNGGSPRRVTFPRGARTDKMDEDEDEDERFPAVIEPSRLTLPAPSTSSSSKPPSSTKPTVIRLRTKPTSSTTTAHKTPEPPAPKKLKGPPMMGSFFPDPVEETTEAGLAETGGEERKRKSVFVIDKDGKSVEMSDGSGRGGGKESSEPIASPAREGSRDRGRGRSRSRGGSRMDSQSPFMPASAFKRLRQSLMPGPTYFSQPPSSRSSRSSSAVPSVSGSISTANNQKRSSNAFGRTSSLSHLPSRTSSSGFSRASSFSSRRTSPTNLEEDDGLPPAQPLALEHLLDLSSSSQPTNHSAPFSLPSSSISGPSALSSSASASTRPSLPDLDLAKLSRWDRIPIGTFRGRSAGAAKQFVSSSGHHDATHAQTGGKAPSAAGVFRKGKQPSMSSFPSSLGGGSGRKMMPPPPVPSGGSGSGGRSRVVSPVVEEFARGRASSVAGGGGAVRESAVGKKRKRRESEAV